ncbi:MAG: hypothetical protein ETSY2_31620 [Candidatus Entotheonella gemina]|uniref:Uncharacterized protein n=1 Tax=Candidatus Entotheonella gemina TaxID=1429439 RepID=W4M0T7_9BACT|nr:MAG: hypothetical protein ETSY2_31620 [Candidatus Entotheonella gemina]
MKFYGILTGVVLCLVYAIWYGVKIQEMPKLVSFLFLLFIGQLLEESINILIVIKKISWDEMNINIGVFSKHIYPITFGSLAGIYGSIYTVLETFNPLFKRRKNLSQLANQLSQLREHMKTQANSREHEAAIGAIASAEIEAVVGYESQVIEHLSRTNQWALEVAQQNGLKEAERAIRRALG